MSVLIEVVCDRCKAVAEGSLTLKGGVRPKQPGWRYVSRDTNLCPPCSDAFEVWRNAGPVPSLNSNRLTINSSLGADAVRVAVRAAGEGAPYGQLS